MDASVVIAIGIVCGTALVVALPKDFNAKPPPNEPEGADAGNDQRLDQQKDLSEVEKEEKLRQEEERLEKEFSQRRQKLQSVGVDVDKMQYVNTLSTWFKPHDI